MYQYKETIDSVPNKGTRVGDRYLNTYVLSTTKGKEKLERSGETDIFEFVQQDLEQSKICNIMARVAKGDLSALRQAEPQYIDTSTMPSTMMEVQNIIVKAKYEFDKFPTEVKQLFNNSAEEYVNEMGTPEFLEKMKPYNLKMEKISMEKNAKEYQKKVREGAQLNYDIAKAQAELGEEIKA